MKVVAKYDSYNDDDQYVSLSIDADIENTKEETAEFARTNILIVDEDDNCIGGSNYPSDDDIFAEKNETFTLTPYETLYTNRVTDIDKCKVIVDTTTFKRNFHKLGEHDVPKENNGCSKVGKRQDLGNGRVYGLTIVKGPVPDEKGADTELTAVVALKNISDENIQHIKCKVSLIDSKDSLVTDNENTAGLPGNASINLESSIYAKDGKLKGSTVKVSLSIFEELVHYNAEAPLTKNKD